ncbi:sensor histidine kinase [Nonomuraea glycinis]|uniref:sensor histidine kinase n=1 Tax=Nonomuraea glycinis TaxID=2047744 RepID=UPI0033A87A1F
MTRPPRGRRTAWTGALRRLPALPLTIRLVLSHMTVLIVALLAINVAADAFGRRLADAGISEVQALMIELTGKGEGSIDFRMILPALIIGMITALVMSLVFSRFLLRPLRQVSAATHRLADGHYDAVLHVPREPGLAALVEDVNRLAAALADIERRRARLVSEIAHEMRTPITILNGQIEGMADGIFTPDDAMFASLTDDLTRLRRLTDDLSSLSRVEEGAFTLRRSLTDVTALAETTVERLRPQFDDARVTLTMVPGPPVTALIDADRVAQVLVNLLGNALRACDPGGRVSVTIRTGDGPAPHAEIIVQDDGIGVAAHDLIRIFARFERVEHFGRPAPAGGSGIGLTIARGIARAHGGDITAASPGLGQGATFTVRLPPAPPGG